MILIFYEFNLELILLNWDVFTIHNCFYYFTQIIITIHSCLMSVVCPCCV